MVDMLQAGVNKALLDRLRRRIRGCIKGDMNDESLKLALGVWRDNK